VSTEPGAGHIEGFIPYRNEYLETIRVIAQSNINETHVEAIQRFFERLMPFLTMPPAGVSAWSSSDFDNYRFIVSELFLYTASLFIRYERFDFLAILVNSRYYLEHEVQYGREAMQHFGVLWQGTDSLDRRNTRVCTHIGS
jgi:hypothetical protein